MQIFIARAYILLNFDTFFPISVAISPLSFSKLLRYHFDTTQLPSNTFPIPTTLYTLHSTPEKSHQNAIFLAYPQILLYLCNLNAKLSNYT